MIQENLNKIKSSIPDSVTLVAVSKTKPASDIKEAYDGGQRIFGENKIQEMVEKYESLPKDIEWHMIGHVQRNKVKYMAPFVSMIHGVDSDKLLNEINKQGEKNNRTINCLLQFHIAQEESKFGFNKDEINSLLENHFFSHLKFVKICGVMGMATNTTNNSQVDKEFSGLRDLFFELTEHFDKDFKIISMGMSGDYKQAINNGSNMVRIGSSIFGARNYQK